VLFAATSSFAGAWKVNEGVVVGQGSSLWTEVLPAEDMDPAHPHPGNIDWYPGPHSTSGGVRFWPSYQWGTPSPAEPDTVCWLYNSSSSIIWWQGSFNNPTTEIVIQLDRCDSNDGIIDIYVDGNLEYSYDSYHATSTQVQIVGTGLSKAPHQVKLQTRLAPPGTETLSINYVAALPTPIPTINEWGMVILLLLLVAAATVVIRRKWRATA
jgi:hypothetical protein